MVTAHVSRRRYHVGFTTALLISTAEEPSARAERSAALSGGGSGSTGVIYGPSEMF